MLLSYCKQHALPKILVISTVISKFYMFIVVVSEHTSSFTLDDMTGLYPV